MSFSESFKFGNSTFFNLEDQVKVVIDGVDEVNIGKRCKNRDKPNATREDVKNNSSFKRGRFRKSKSDSTLSKATATAAQLDTVENYSEFFRSEFTIPVPDELKTGESSIMHVSELKKLLIEQDERNDNASFSALDAPIFSDDVEKLMQALKEEEETAQHSLSLAALSDKLLQEGKQNNETAEEVQLLDATSFICPAADSKDASQLMNDLHISRHEVEQTYKTFSTEVSRVSKSIKPKELVSTAKKVTSNNCENKTACPMKYAGESDLNALKHMSAWNLPNSVLAEYSKKGVVKMFDWQVECLSNAKVLFEHRNLVYSAPTSAGKTLVSEVLLLKTVLERGKKVLLILPFISVVREKMFYLQDLLTTAGYRVEGFYGGYTPPGGFDSIHVAICTIEKANSIVNKLLEQNKLDIIGTVIVDEVHLISDPGRGYILELLLAKVLYMSRKYGLQIQVITMSATLSNVGLLKRWLDAELFITDFRPVALQEMIKIGNKIYDSNMRFLRDVTQCRDGEPQLFPALPNDADHVAQLCIETLLDGCSVVIFCPSKDWCENLAVQLAGMIHSLVKSGSMWGTQLRAQIKRAAIDEVKKQLRDIPTGLDTVLEKTITYACAFHHAGLTTEERDIVEGSFKSGTLKVIVATSTLSSGVNLPARRVLIRTPLFGGKQMSSLTYRQMIGRAGRTGKDTLGESILICSDNNARIGRDLITADLKPITSCLEMDNSTHLKRALLEVISSGVASTKEDIDSFIGCTLLSAQKQLLAQEQRQENAKDVECINEALNFLIEYEFVRQQLNEETREQNYVATRLGMACLASSMPPTDGLILFAELQKSRRCFVLESELHAVYLVTPYSVCYQLQNLDWLLYLDLWEKLSPAMKKVGELVGVKESFLVRAMRGQTKLDYKLMQIHKRFYTALALQELVNETPINVVARKYKCTRGMLQSLQQMSSTFAGIVTAFCNSLQWSTLSLIVSQFKERLFFGIHCNLIDLMRLPDLNHKRARALYDAGITTLVELAHSDAFTVERVLYNALSFDSAKQNEHEDVHEAEQRNAMRNFFITGKAGITVAEAARLLVEEARRFVQYEIGVGDIKWSQSLEGVADANQNEQLHMSCQEDKLNSAGFKRRSNDNVDTEAAVKMKKTSQGIGAAEAEQLKTAGLKTEELSKRAEIVAANATTNLADSKTKHSMQNADNLPTIEEHNSKQVSQMKIETKKSKEQNVQSREDGQEKTNMKQVTKIPTNPEQEYVKNRGEAKAAEAHQSENPTVVESQQRPTTSLKKPDRLENVKTAQEPKKDSSDKMHTKPKNIKIENAEYQKGESTAVTESKERLSTQELLEQATLMTTKVVEFCEDTKFKEVPRNTLGVESMENEQRDEKKIEGNKRFGAKNQCLWNGDCEKLKTSNEEIEKIKKENIHLNVKQARHKRTVKDNPSGELVVSEKTLESVASHRTHKTRYSQEQRNDQERPSSNKHNIAQQASKQHHIKSIRNPIITAQKHDTPKATKFQAPSGKLLTAPRRSPRNHGIKPNSTVNKLKSSSNQSCDMHDLFMDDESFELNSGITNALEAADELHQKAQTPLKELNKSNDEIPSSQHLTDNVTSSTTTFSPSSSRFMRSCRKHRMDSTKTQTKVSKAPENQKLPTPIVPVTECVPPTVHSVESPTDSSNSIEISNTSMQENSLIKHPMQLNASHILCCSKENPAATSFECIQIVDICGHEQLFMAAFKELLELKCFGFCLGLQQQTGSHKPLIGGKLLINQVGAAEQAEANAAKTSLFQVDDTTYLAGIAFGLNENVVYYMNMQDEGSYKGLDAKIKCLYLRSIFRASAHTLVIFDAKEQLKMLRRAIPDLGQISANFEDPMVANWLLQPDAALSLQQMTQQFAPECTALVNLCGSGRGYHSYGLDAQSAIFAKIRCCIEACVTPHVLSGQIENMERICSGQLCKFFKEIEMPLQLSLCDMETIGFPVSQAELRKLFQQSVETTKKLEAKIFELNRSRFNLGSAAAVAKVLGLHRKANGRISTCKQILEKIDSPMSQLIITHRKLSVMLTKSITPLLHCVQNDRIHGQSITFTSTGRISMSEPNLQNVAKDFDVDMGAEKLTISCRSAFFPSDTKRSLISADFCQLEMRILAHLSQDATLLKVMKTEKDLFTAIAARWNKVPEQQVSEQLRNATKQICYGIVYGMGMRSLAEALKCNEQEAMLVSEQFHAAYPAIRAYAAKVIKFARQNGYVETITGRRRYLEHINNGEPNMKSQAERQAVNSAIQGSAADIAKTAILRIEKYISKYRDKLGIEENAAHLVLHLHDELIFEVPTDKAKKIAKVLSVTMESCVKLQVPLRVKLKIGRSWGELKEVKL